MKRVIAVLNNLKTADNVLTKALELSTNLKAVLEILYIHEEPLFEIPNYFQSEDSIKNDVLDKGKIKKEIKEMISKLGSKKEVAILVFIDDTVDRVLSQTKDESDILIVTAYHKKITEKLAKKSHLPILVIKNDIKAYKKIVVPVDLTENSLPCVVSAQQMFKDSQMKLLYDYRYIVDISLADVDYLGVPTSTPIIDTQLNQEIEEGQKEAFGLLKKETGLDGDFIEESLSIEEDLTEYINVGRYDLTFLCTSDQDFIFSKSISFKLLKTVMSDILIYR